MEIAFAAWMIGTVCVVAAIGYLAVKIVRRRLRRHDGHSSFPD